MYEWDGKTPYGRDTVPPLETLPWPQTYYRSSSDGDGFLTRQAVIVTGWSALEVTGTAAASLVLWDGDATTGMRKALVKILAGDGQVMSPGWPGIPFMNGLYWNATSGTLLAAIWAIPMPGGV